MIFQNTELQIVKVEIGLVKSDVLVNMVSRSLTGSSASGSLHVVAGEELFKACLRLGNIPLGKAGITEGYNLPCKFVIHTVCPIFGQENGFEASYLEDCYKNTLQIAEQKEVRSIAFPAISGGIGKYPIEEAAPIALESIKEYLESNSITTLNKVIISCDSEAEYNEYEAVLKEVFI